MITRIVKLSIAAERAQEFTELFKKNNEQIREFNGCERVSLKQDERTGCFFTISQWASEDHLNAYRESDLFQSIWPTVKSWMIAKPEAWSLKDID